MATRYEQAILDTLRASDRPLLMRELVDLVAPGIYEAYGAIGNTLTCLYRVGRVARSKSDNSERGKWYEYSYLAEPAQKTTAGAELVAEVSALRAELEAAKEDNAALLIALREIDSSEWLPPRVQCQLDLIRQAEHPGRALMAELTRRMAALEQERDAALEREQILLAAAEQAWRALLERTPHSVPGGEQACKALHAAIVKVIANKARGEPQ